MTPDDLLAIMPLAKPRIAAFFTPLLAAMAEFDIGTSLRQACFLAQVGHESGQLVYVRELASGRAYEGRADLGNFQEGDGVRFKGRGLIQVTGRTNYRACSMALFADERLLQFPELLEDPENACRSAGWYWKSKGLNQVADTGDMVKITHRINGGENGLANRLALFESAKRVLGC